jgi:two-component system phosphate regulon sensor histidine kinase PhoR
VRAEAQGGQAAIEVSDTGIGIPQESLRRVFERFYRTDEARNRASGGAGLGLSIAQKLVEEHGGRIEATSEVGRGSTFTVLLPLLRSTGRRSAAPARSEV